MRNKILYVFLSFVLMTSACTHQSSYGSSREVSSTMIGDSSNETSDSPSSDEIQLFYESVGDGTCLAYLAAGEEVVVPEYSPYGDLVIAVCTFCSSTLKKVTLPNTIREFSYPGFRYCFNLESVNIPTAMQEIDDYSFQECKKLKDISIPGNVSEIGRYAFSECTSIQDVDIPKGCRRISSGAFAYCSNLKKVSLPSSLQFLGGDAFFRCSSLTSVTLPGSLAWVGVNTFYGCTDLSSIVIEDGVGEIYADAFSKCPIKKIFIPKSVSFPNHTAFQSCPEDLVIYCEAESKPDNWADDWNSENYTVVWGAKREDVQS